MDRPFESPSPLNRASRGHCSATSSKSVYVGSADQLSSWLESVSVYTWPAATVAVAFVQAVVAGRQHGSSRRSATDRLLLWPGEERRGSAARARTEPRLGRARRFTLPRHGPEGKMMQFGMRGRFECG